MHNSVLNYKISQISVLIKSSHFIHFISLENSSIVAHSIEEEGKVSIFVECWQTNKNQNCDPLRAVNIFMRKSGSYRSFDYSSLISDPLDLAT